MDALELREPIRLELASHPVDASDVFLYHKTTHRQVYDAARMGCTESDDVLLYNQRRRSDGDLPGEHRRADRTRTLDAADLLRAIGRHAIALD